MFLRRAIHTDYRRLHTLKDDYIRLKTITYTLTRNYIRLSTITYTLKRDYVRLTANYAFGVGCATYRLLILGTLPCMDSASVLCKELSSLTSGWSGSLPPACRLVLLFGVFRFARALLFLL